MAQNKLLYTFGKTILFPAYKLLYRFKVKNKGAVPPEGGVILASNHMSFADPVLLGLSEKRRLYFMAKQELFRNKFAGAVMCAVGAANAAAGRAVLHHQKELFSQVFQNDHSLRRYAHAGAARTHARRRQTRAEKRHRHDHGRNQENEGRG